MAQVNVIGRITADLELKTSEKSNPYVRFDIAENIGSRQTLHTQYFQVCAWGEDANRLMKAHAKKGSLKPTYLRTLNSQLSAIFNFAVKYYGLGSNPVQKSGTIGKKNSGLEQIWTADEFKIFIDAVSDKLQSKVIFNLLYWTGMRSGEMLALTLNDFDFEERTVSITKNYARIDGEDLFLDPKTPKSNRKITLPQFVCDLVKDYADRLYGYDPSDRLFEVTKHYLKHEMERGCKKTGLREIRVHDLRHSHASLLIELGFAPLLISERLGHESVTTTLEIYSHLYPTKHGEVADRLEAFA